MSLINKMLRDLETRQPGTAADPAARPVYQDLRSTMQPRRDGRITLLVGVLMVSLVGAGGFYAWDQWGRVERPTVSAAAPVPDVTAQPPTSPAPPPAQTAPVPLAETVPTVPVVPPTSEPTPVAMETMSAPEANAVAPAPATNQDNVAPPRAAAPKKVTTKSPRALSALDSVNTGGAMDKRIRPFTADEQAESAYRKALQYVEQGRSDDATRELTEALRVAPQHTGARVLMVGIALKHGRRREAQQLLEAGIAQSPTHYAFAQLLARIHMDEGAESKALALLEGVAPLASNDPDFAVLMATALQRVGRHADAVAAFQRAVDLRPGDARAWLGLAISLEADRKSQPARLAYERAKQLGGLSPALASYADKRLAALRAAE